MKPKFITLSLASLAMMAVSCTNDVVVDSNRDPIGDAISFSTSVRSATRATSTTKTNLGSFGVYARALNDDGLYATFLVGSSNEDGSHTPDIAKRTGENLWELDHNIYWPDGVKTLHFWAATARQTTTGTDTGDEILPTNTNFGFEAGSAYPSITGFTPYANHSQTETYADGANQVDLMAAFTHQLSTVENHTSVSLDFKHTLSKVQIMAKVGEGQSEHRIVKIKGAWIVNAKTGKTLNLNFDAEQNYQGAFLWQGAGTATTYGSYYPNDVKTISTGNQAADILSISTLSGSGTMMLTPCSVGKWDRNPADEDGERKSFDNCTTTQAYILLLCRMETEHEGDKHEGDNNVLTVDANHRHQMFPHVNDETGFDDTAYGYTCVPVDINWELGKSYTYVLDIWGAKSGGGYYPPNNPDLPDGATPPDGKVPGDVILDSGITFTVNEFKDWTSGSTDASI